MLTRRKFLQNNSMLALGTVLMPSLNFGNDYLANVGLQLYSVRKEMLEAPVVTLQKLAAMGIKQLESAGSEKGHYYGLTPQEIRNIAKDMGMTVRSGHVQLDANWSKTLQEALDAGQEYLIVSSLPSSGQTIDNYKKVAEQFNDAGAEAKSAGIRLGYHNHDYEFAQEKGTVLYDVLLEETEPSFVCMELDLGWVIAAGKDPLQYFKKYPGRFPLWHLKDMNLKKKMNTEFGKGSLNIKAMFAGAKQSGLRYFFIEQEEYSVNAFESIRYDLNYLKSV
jgi:sugar phosphate isomerase/epimerase